jgi:hypothetical protein
MRCKSSGIGIAGLLLQIVARCLPRERSHNGDQPRIGFFDTWPIDGKEDVVGALPDRRWRFRLPVASPFPASPLPRHPIADLQAARFDGAAQSRRLRSTKSTEKHQSYQ